jgi:hypothetical protein
MLPQKNSGQTIVEAMIAISLITFGVLGVFRLTSQSLGLTSTVRDQYIANYLAVEGIEIVKNIVDTNIQEGNTWNKNISVDGAQYEIDYFDTSDTISPAQGLLLRLDSSTGLYSYSLGSNLETGFKRTITILYPDCAGSPCDHMEVSSIVDWTARGGGEFSVNLEDHFYNWNQ